MQWLEESQPVRLIDVREPDEWEICRLPRAELRPLEDIAQWSQTLDTTERLVVYCHHGIRSLYAALYLSGHGFTSDQPARRAGCLQRGGRPGIATLLNAHRPSGIEKPAARTAGF